MSVPIQIKLLTVLQERRYSPVGSHEQLRFDGRVIAATNRSLAELRASAEFRDDFLYRLCSDVIEVPPLRQRLQEHPPELEQAVRRILLNGCYEGVTTETGEDEESSLATDIRAGSLTATDLLSRYCRALYARMGSYEQVARHIDLDRRTVKKYIERGAS